jgi:hypothetical protein
MRKIKLTKEEQDAKRWIIANLIEMWEMAEKFDLGQVTKDDKIRAVGLAQETVEKSAVAFDDKFVIACIKAAETKYKRRNSQNKK